MTRIQVAIEFRFLRIPTQWSFDGKRFTPNLNQGTLVPSVVPLDGWRMRNRFQRLKDDEESILEFLSDVGVWAAVPDPAAYETPWNSERRKRVLYGAFGSRFFEGLALPIDIAQFKIQRERWKQLLGDKSAMKARFGKPPSNPQAKPGDKLQFATDSHFYNELPLRIEWRGGLPVAVSEAITGWELLLATTHADLLRDAGWRICKRRDCAARFAVTTNHKRKYCEWNCAHLESVRKARRKHSPPKRKGRS